MEEEKEGAQTYLNVAFGSWVNETHLKLRHQATDVNQTLPMYAYRHVKIIQNIHIFFSQPKENASFWEIQTGTKEVQSTLHTWSYLGSDYESGPVYPSLQTRGRALQGQGHTAKGLGPQSVRLQTFSAARGSTSVMALDCPRPGVWGGMSPGESRWRTRRKWGTLLNSKQKI